jgi:arylsulfotransferase ASST
MPGTTIGAERCYGAVKAMLRIQGWKAAAAAVLGAASVLASAGAAGAAPIGAYTTKGAYSFVSAPKLHPPKVRADVAPQGKLAPGYFMVANFPNLGLTQPASGKAEAMVGQSGPLMLDSHLQPVWFNPVPTNVVALNLKAQTYDGKPVLSWWQGVINSAGNTISGEDVVVDQHYRQIATVKGQGGWVVSEHEIVISGHDAWVTAYKNIPMNLTAEGGPANGVLIDAAVQEYDLTNGNLLYTWDALQHIPLAQSETAPAPALVNGQPVPWDAYHVNSIQLTGNDTFLVSMRNTWAAYTVDQSTNSIEWALGGKPFAGVPTFKFASGASFEWQHDVEMHPGNVVSVFDDNCCLLLAGGKFGPPNGSARGLVIKLNLSNHTASFVAKYSRTPTVDVAFLGNTDLLPGGNVVVGWGSQAFFSEFSKSGKLLMDAEWPGPDRSYRAFVQNWVGTPSFPPSGGVRTAKGKTTVYASWDGATQVAEWAVLAGQSSNHLSRVATATKSGFETAIGLTGSYKSYKVQALDSKGHVLGTSSAFPKSAPPSPGFY